jgi:hypothetical protein
MAAVMATLFSAAVVGQITLHSQCSYLHDKQLDIMILIVQTVEDSEGVLGVPLRSSCDVGCIQMAGVRCLDECLEIHPDLISRRLLVPIVKLTSVAATLQQQMHDIVEQCWGV